MKILHLTVGNYFIDNYSYQENNLTKFHKLQGYDVEVISSLFTYDANGKKTVLQNLGEYINEHGVKVTRLDYRSPKKIYRKLKRFVGLKQALDASLPDILFIHNLQFMDMDVVIRFLKNNPETVVYVDSHVDFSNSATNFLSKNIFHKVLWKRAAHMIEPYTTKFYGVLPARVDFLKNIYKLPAEKCELLVMGADDELVEAASKPEVREEIRRKYNISDGDFLIMTGGKIDAFKTQTLLLMEAVKRINDPKVKLIVFGSVTPDLKDKVNALCDGTKVQYIGWIQAKDSYKYFATADLVVFPGRHSVFWEQVTGQGIPMLVKYWDGTTHVDLGGNVEFLTEDSTDEIQQKIIEILSDPQKYADMKRIAQSKGMEVFSYRKIAERCIEAK